jgi:PAS domain S-box-containing protein
MVELTPLRTHLRQAAGWLTGIAVGFLLVFAHSHCGDIPSYLVLPLAGLPVVVGWLARWPGVAAVLTGTAAAATLDGSVTAWALALFYGAEAGAAAWCAARRQPAPQFPADNRLRLLESAVVHARDAVIILEAAPNDGPGRSVLYVNEAFTHMTGYAPAEVVGRSLHLLRGPKTNPDTLDRLRDALAAGAPLQVELLNYRKGGSELWVELSLVPVLGAAGRCSHWVMIQRDITDRRRAAEALQRSEGRLRAIYQNTSAGIAVYAADGRIIEANPALAKMLGYPVKELLGQTLDAITHPDDFDTNSGLIREVLQEERTGYAIQKRFLRRDGEPVWVELYSQTLRDETGAAVSAVAVVVDVTERRRLEEQLRQAQKMEMVGQMAGGIAHDFNNLLTGVIGNLALLSLPPDAANAELLAAAERAAHRAAELTRKLLGLARKNQLLVAPVRVAEFASEVVSILRRTVDPRIEVVTELAVADPVAVDATLLNQALLNLCLNARDAMPHGGRLSIRAAAVWFTPEEVADHPEARPGGFVRLAVEDTGCGMSPETRARVFEPFFTTKPIGQGTGLGLPMVHGIVKQHGGWIVCDSELGRGTRFDLYLPRAAVASGVPRPSVCDTPPAIDVATPVPTSGRTVLLVDDEDMIRTLGRSVLEAAGYEVLEAEDGADAVDLFRREHGRIDLVILDLTMPRLSGRDAFRSMTAIVPDARVLFSSGYSADDLSDVTGAVGLLAKPYRPQELVTAVHRALTGHPAAHTPAG